MLGFFMDGKPMGKQRRTKQGYTPPQTRRYEAKARKAFMEQCGASSVIEGPVAVAWMAVFPVPKSWSKKKKRLAWDQDMPHTQKPDVDNIEKIILDSLNHTFLWEDDCYVNNSIGFKRFAKEGEEAGVYVWLFESYITQEWFDWILKELERREQRGKVAQNGL